MKLKIPSKRIRNSENVLTKIILNHILYASPDKGVNCDRCKELLSNSPDLGTTESTSFCANLYINDSNVVSIVNCDPGGFKFSTKEACEKWYEVSDYRCKCDRLCYVSAGPDVKIVENPSCDGNSTPC